MRRRRRLGGSGPGTPPATKLGILTQPDNTATAGSALSQQAVIEVQDASGVRVTTGAGATASVTVTLASGPGAVGGTLTVSAVAGVATFTNVTISVGGVNTLDFTSGTLTHIVSAAFANGPLTRHQTASGSFLDATKWDNSGLLPHYTVDTLIIDAAVASTLSSAKTIGNDGLTSSKRLQVAATATFTISATLTLSAPFQFDGLVVINQPGNIVASSATSKVWPIGPSVNGTTAIMQVRGTAGTHVTFSTSGNGNAYFYNGNGSNKFGFDAEYLDVNGWGIAGTAFGYWLFQNGNGAGQISRLQHVTTTAAGGISALGMNVAADIDYQYVKEVRPQLLSSSSGLQFQSMAAATTGLRVFKHNAMMNTTVTWFDLSMTNWSIDDNVWARAQYIGLRDNVAPSLFQNWLFYQRGNTMTIGGPGHTETGGVTMIDAIGISSSYLGYANNAASGTHILDMVCLQTTANDGTADGSLCNQTITSGAMVDSFRRHLDLKNSAGGASSGISSGHDISFRKREIRHATCSLVQEASGALNVMTGAVTVTGTKVIQRCEDSIFYAYGAGITSRGRQYYANDPASGHDTTNGLRFTSIAGGTSTVIKAPVAKTYDTSSNGSMVAAGASLIVTNTNGVVGAPPQGESHVITANTGNTITTAGFTGTAWDGVDYMILVIDQNDPTTNRNNYMFGCNTGVNYDITGQPTAAILGHIGFVYSVAPEVNSVNGGAGTDPIANGPQFLLDEPTWDVVTADQDFMGFSADTAWVTAHAYALGDYVSHSSSDFFGSRTINFICIQAHTSSSTNDINEPGKRPGSSAYRNFWQLAAIERVQNATAAGTTYTNNSIALYGDTASTPAANVTPIQMVLSRIRWAKRPTNATLLAMSVNSQDSICPGAVNGNAAFP